MKENNMDYDKLQEMFEEFGIPVFRTKMDDVEKIKIFVGKSLFAEI